MRSSDSRRRPGPQRDEAMDAALKALADYDKANAKLQATATRRTLAQFHVGRIPLLRTRSSRSPRTPEDQLSYNKQIVDSLVAAYQTGLYPNGLQGPRRHDRRGDGKLASYAAFRKIGAEFAMQERRAGRQPPGQPEEVDGRPQGLPRQVSASPTRPPTPCSSSASANEFNAEEDEARKYYTKLVESFPDTPSRQEGRRGPAAARPGGQAARPQGDGPPGRGDRHRRSTSGKTVLVAFWATWADPVRRDLPELVKLYQKYHGQGLRDRRREPRQRASRPRRLPQGATRSPGRRSSSRAASRAGSPPSTASSRCRR